MHKKKKTVTKVQRWEEKLFSALVDEKVSGVDERFMETKMAFYYQNMDTEDLVMAGSISDIENGYLLLSDLGLRALLSLYCAKIVELSSHDVNSCNTIRLKDFTFQLSHEHFFGKHESHVFQRNVHAHRTIYGFIGVHLNPYRQINT